MKEEINLHFARSDEYLYDAELLLREGRIASAVGRAYYSMFHAATAVLLSKGIQRSSHHALISAFGQFIIKPGLIDYVHQQSFQQVFDLRRECDYEPIIDVTDNEAAEILKKAEFFVAACGKIVNRG